MFFSLARFRDLRFPCHTQLGPWTLNHDRGWQQHDDGVVKTLGACNDDLGFWTQFHVTDRVVQLRHARLRGYPLWWDADHQVLTNLAGQGQAIWADQQVDIAGDQLVITQIDIIGAVTGKTLTIADAVQTLSDVICNKIAVLYDHTPQWTKCHFETGGVDTAIIKAALVSTNREFHALDFEHFEYDAFTNATKDILREHYWAYRQIHHWRDPTIFLTGSGGDEFLMRGPTTLALWAAWHDIDLASVLCQRQGYHVAYFLREKNLAIIKRHWQQRQQIQELYPKHRDLVWQICNMNANDHQHWHLGNTFTWSPYHDLELTKIMLSLGPDDLLDHAIDATVTKRVIESLCPGQLTTLATDKNLHSRSRLPVYG
jgi:hypothetical protein